MDVCDYAPRAPTSLNCQNSSIRTRTSRTLDHMVTSQEHAGLVQSVESVNGDLHSAAIEPASQIALKKRKGLLTRISVLFAMVCTMELVPFAQCACLAIRDGVATSSYVFYPSPWVAHAATRQCRTVNEAIRAVREHYKRPIRIISVDWVEGRNVHVIRVDDRRYIWDVEVTLKCEVKAI